MIRLLLPLVLIALSSAPDAGPGAHASVARAGSSSTPSRSTRTALPVMDLKPDEVEVWIGHFRVPIESFTVVTPAADPSAGRLTVLVLDDVTLPLQPAGPRASDVARRFVSKMRPEDRMAIVTLDGSAMETTNDRARLLQDDRRATTCSPPGSCRSTGSASTCSRSSARCLDRWWKPAASGRRSWRSARAGCSTGRSRRRPPAWIRARNGSPRCRRWRWPT